MADIAKFHGNCDKPVERQDENFSEESNFHPGQSPQGQSSINSHAHDSEYDTASELEGGEEDEYEDDSLGVDEEDDLEGSENGSIDFDAERQRGDGQEQSEYSKKVDEDRSNPQYIPKRGTFYEHDDRTADDPEDNVSKGEEGCDGDATNLQAPVTLTTSKPMKKWQAASAVDRWSHDRYDENEQAPKSRAELVSAYGYDIRSEDGPPRARRRRRYGRGPSKYVRNWEDENAYIKSSSASVQRKPRPEDFPALGDREKKNRKNRNFREEKENRYERHNEKNSGGGMRNNNNNNNMNVSHRDRDRDRNDKDNRSERRSGKNFRQSRQSMEFKSQNRPRPSINEGNRNQYGREKDDIRNISDDHRNKTQLESVSFTNAKVNVTYNDKFNGHENMSISKTSQLHSHELKDKISTINPTTFTNRQMQSQQQSQMQAKLQHMQATRTEPSTNLGNIQMHSLVTQTQPNSAPEMTQNVAETGRTAKRYSSLRQRSQGDAQLPTTQPPQQNSQLDQHSLQQQIQQMHDHHQQTQNQAQPQHVLLQDQHLLQANLMQLYHTQQENLQAQMQGVTIQSIPTVPAVPNVQGVQTKHQSKPQYQNVQHQQQYQTSSTAAPPATAYYASTNEYTPTNPSQAIQPQYGQPQQTPYIQQQPTASQIAAFNTQTQSAGPPGPAPQPMPSTLNYVQTSATTNTAAPYQNYSSFQNFNTVGGTTYFVPQQQPPPRPVVPAQRRPTNAIPILAPPTNDNTKFKKSENIDDNKGSVIVGSSSLSSSAASAPVGSAENIDHILDNMFVQRPPYQPPTRKSSSPATESVGTSTTTIITNNTAIGDEQIKSFNEQQQQQPIATGGVTASGGMNTSETSQNDTSQLEESLEKIVITGEKLNPEQNLQSTSPSITTITNVTQSETG